MVAIIRSLSAGVMSLSTCTSGSGISASAVGSGLFRNLLKCSATCASCSAPVVSSFPCLCFE